MSKIINIALAMLAAIIVYALLGFLTAIPLYFLWNWLMPELFGLSAISYIQAWGLIFVAAILLKSSSGK